MSDAKPIPVLTDRDRSILRDLIESRVMTLTQISDLHFSGSYEYAKKRLQRFKAARYVRERKPRHNPGYYHAAMLFLSREGFAAVADDPFVRGEAMSWDDLRARLDFAESTLTHELEVVDMKVAFTSAVRSRSALALREFSTYPRRYQFQTEHIETGRVFTLKPDGYARVSLGDGCDRAFFFEWDRSSEAHRKLAVKAYGYQRYIESGAYAIWNGGSAKDIDQHPATPVFILPNEERRNNAAEHLLRLRHPRSRAALQQGAILFTTHDAFLADPLASIYITLCGYREATEGTPYDPAHHKAMARVRDRDRLVADRVRTTDIFGGMR